MDNGFAFPVMDACVPMTATVLEPRVHDRRLRSGARSRKSHWIQCATVNSSVFSVWGDFLEPSMANSCWLSRAGGGGDAGNLTPR